MADTDILQVIAEARVDARSLSEFVFKPANFMVTRRLAPSINTLEYYLNHFRNVEAEGNNSIARANNVISAAQASANTAINNIIIDGNAQISNAISNAGFVQVGTFAVGATLNNRNDVIQASDGKLYRWGGSLPKTVAASSTPANSGGFASNAWIEVSDASLSQKLAGLGGASIIGSGVSVFNNMAEFLAAESQIQDGAKVFLASIKQGLDLDGNGRLYTYSLAPSSDAISIKTPSGYLSRKFDGKVYIAECGATGADYDIDSPALQTAFDIIRNNDGGILSMGENCTYYMEGVYTANVSNLEWVFNNTTVYVGMFLIKWHPYQTGYGNYNNINISDATWIGNRRPKNNRTGYVHMDFVLCDDINITGCTYIEATYAGHNVDLMGCREVTFEGNYVLGSCLDFSERWHSETVQISNATTGGAGTPIDAASRPFFSGDYHCIGVYFRKNTYKPYINPITGIKTYPPRPIGNHSYNDNRNIEITDNYFEDIVRLNRDSNADRYSAAVVSFGFAGDVTITGNDFISTNGNYAAIYLNGYATVAENEGFTPEVNISDNNFNFKGLLPDQPVITATTLIRVGYDPAASTKETNVMGARINIKSNEIELDATNSNAETYNVIGLVYTVNNCDVNVYKNKLKPIGKVGNFILVPSSAFGYRRGGSITIDSNYVGDILNGFAVDIPTQPVGAEYEGHAIHFLNNVFINQWRIANLHGSGTTDVKGNRFIGGSNVSPEGVVGDYYTIIINRQRHLSLSDNIVYADSRETYININNAGYAQSEAALQPYEFRRVN